MQQINSSYSYYSLLPVTCLLGLAAGYGDPNIRTLDGLAYTFNCVGEFLLLRHSNTTLPGGRFTGLEVQSRMERLSHRGGRNGSVFTAFMFAIVGKGLLDFRVETRINQRAGGNIV